MDKSANTPIGQGVVGELIERGLTKIDSGADKQLLEEIARISRLIHRGEIDGCFGLASDPNSMIDNQADVVVFRQDGFSFLRVKGTFIRDFTKILGLASNVPDSVKSGFIGNTQDFMPRTFNAFGVEDPQMPAPLYDGALALKDQLPLIAHLIEKVFDFATAAKFQDLFSPRLSEDYLIEFPLYEVGSTVEETLQDAPVHQHDATNETVVSFQLTDSVTEYIAGRDVQNLEQVTQSQGEGVVIDSRVFHGPKPQDKERAALVVIARGDDAREVLHRGLNQLGRDTNWQPTSVHDRVSLQTARDIVR